jgi:hypothetical protein
MEMKRMLYSDEVHKHMGCSYLWPSIGGACAHVSGCSGKKNEAHFEHETSFDVKGAQEGTRKTSPTDELRYLQEFREKGNIQHIGDAVNPEDTEAGQWRTYCRTATSEVSTGIPEDTPTRRADARTAFRRARILVEPRKLVRGKFTTKTQRRAYRKAGTNFMYRILTSERDKVVTACPDNTPYPYNDW